MSTKAFDARAAMLAAMKKRPDLTPAGLNGQGRANFEERRNALLHPTTLDEFERAIAWLRLVPRRANINQNHSSYGLKHAAERWAGAYVSNGALIAAALHLGIRLEQCRGREGINALLAVSSRRKWPLAVTV
jgi:hypothetical protein